MTLNIRPGPDYVAISSFNSSGFDWVSSGCGRVEFNEIGSSFGNFLDWAGFGVLFSIGLGSALMSETWSMRSALTRTSRLECTVALEKVVEIKNVDGKVLRYYEQYHVKSYTTLPISKFRYSYDDITNEVKTISSNPAKFKDLDEYKKEIFVCLTSIVAFIALAQQTERKTRELRAKYSDDCLEKKFCFCQVILEYDPFKIMTLETLICQLIEMRHAITVAICNKHVLKLNIEHNIYNRNMEQ
ncbi:hypothetical protein Bhyg_10474 [Pseudolycoriella hygida]|uniref:Uncharacterized protein n=1 Tax=Pseudolycoriella hygida TaxID=35572 RepID=A0A9Q0RZC6_9DIPT|nr:hypothetical protein Bhyg_10474 [Pseudolycoriella hygida]